MRFTLYSSAKRPTKGQLCTAELFNEVTHSDRVYKLCAAISHCTDSEERSKLKSQLPVITWQAEFDGARKAKLAKPSGLFMLDIDHVEHPFKLYSEKIIPLKDELQIMFAGMTASQHGLRIVAKCRPEFRTIEECQRWAAEKIGVEYDEVCKDWARCSFVVSADYTYYMDGNIFSEEPAEGTVYEVENSETVTFDSKKSKHDKKDMSEDGEKSEDEGETEIDQREGLFGGVEEFRGIKLEDIANAYLEATGGIPEPGERNIRLFRLAMRLRYIADFNEATLFKVMPHLGLGDEEMKTLIHSACGSVRGSNIPKDLIDVVDKLEKRSLLFEDEEVDEEIITDTAKLPPMPPIIKQFVEIAPADFKMATVMCQLPILGTLGSKLRAKYLDGNLHSPSFMVSLEAPQASGKSFMRKLSEYELRSVIDHDEDERAKEREYEDKIKTMKLLNQKITPENKDEILGSKPKTLIRYVPATMSITKLLMRMEAAQGLHLFAMSEEIDTVTKAFKRGFSSYSDLLRVAFDNGKYGQDYASENSFSGNINIYYNFLTSGTPKAMRRFYPDVEDGLVSRVVFVTLPDQFAKQMPVWKEFNEKQKSIVDRSLELLNEITLQGDEVQPEHVMKMDWLNDEMKKWILMQQAEALRTDDRTRDIFCRRSAVVGFRAGMLAYFLWGEKSLMRKNVIKFATWVSNCMLNQHLLRFNIQGTNSNTNPWEEVYNRLGDTFTREELKVALRRNGNDTPVKIVVFKWRICGLIEGLDGYRSVKNGKTTYDKFKKKK